MDQVYLFSPGDSRKKLEKAINSQADVIIIDLEDGVSDSNKAQARQIISNLWQDVGSQSLQLKKIAIRINSLASAHFEEDLKLLQELHIERVMISKCEGADEINKIHESLPDAELIPLMESAIGIQNLSLIISSSPHIKKVAFGAVDFALDLGADWSVEGDERKFAMNQLVFMSRALGIQSPIDAVYPIIDNKATFQRDTEYGKKIGFYGKMVIHPSHIEWVREVYQVTAEQLEWSKRVVWIYENAAGKGSMELDGKLIDYPIYKKAKRMTAMLASDEL